MSFDSVEKFAKKYIGSLIEKLNESLIALNENEIEKAKGDSSSYQFSSLETRFFVKDKFQTNNKISILPQTSKKKASVDLNFYHENSEFLEEYYRSNIRQNPLYDKYFLRISNKTPHIKNIVPMISPSQSFSATKRQRPQSAAFSFLKKSEISSTQQTVLNKPLQFNLNTISRPQTASNFLIQGRNKEETKYQVRNIRVALVRGASKSIPPNYQKFFKRIAPSSPSIPNKFAPNKNIGAMNPVAVQLVDNSKLEYFGSHCLSYLRPKSFIDRLKQKTKLEEKFLLKHEDLKASGKKAY